MTRERRIPPPDRNALRTQSLILRTTGFFLLPLLLLFALFLLLRGHNAPGGGFIAGLVASAAIAVHLFAMSEAGARRVLRVDPATCSPGADSGTGGRGAWSVQRPAISHRPLAHPEPAGVR